MRILSSNQNIANNRKRPSKKVSPKKELKSDWQIIQVADKAEKKNKTTNKKKNERKERKEFVFKAYVQYLFIPGLCCVFVVVSQWSTKLSTIFSNKPKKSLPN